MKSINDSVKKDFTYKWVMRLVILIGFIIIGRGMYKYFSEKKEVYDNRNYTIGTIIDYDLIPRSGAYEVKYKYFVEDEEYVNVNGIDRIMCKNCIGKKYKVIYSKKNPEKSFLLATEKMFKDLNIKIPKKMEIE